MSESTTSLASNRVSSTPFKLKRNYMSRRHLCDRLVSVCKDSVAVIVAPPGYGKSSLIAEMCQILGERENTLVAYYRIPPNCGHAEFESAFGDLAVLHSETADASENYCFIEDVHNLNEWQLSYIFDCIAALRNNDVQVVITAIAWSYPLLGLCTRVEISAFEKDFLRFTREETKLFIAKSAGTTMPETYVDAVYDFTQGWQTGIYLLSIEAGLNDDESTFGRNRFINGYFSSLVSSLCDAEMTDFLYDTSFLDELDPSLCAYVAKLYDQENQDSRMRAVAMLEDIEQLGLFISRKSNDIDAIAQYEKPFKLWLQSVFTMKYPAKTQEVNKAACDWHTSHGNNVQAIKYMLMSGYAASSFKDVWAAADEGADDFEVGRRLQWIGSLSRDEVVANPAFDVLAGWFFIRSGRSVEAADCIVMGNDALSKAGNLRQHDVDLITGHFECLTAKCLNMEGLDEEFVESYNVLLEKPSISENISLRCVMTFSLAESYERLGAIQESQNCYREAIALSNLCGDVYARGLSAYNLARRLVGEGDLHGADQMCRANMEACTASYRGLLHVLLARIGMLANRIDEADEALVEAYSYLASGNLDFQLDYVIARSLRDEIDGQIDIACSSLMHGITVAKQNKIRQRGILTRLQIQWAFLLFIKGDYYRCREALSEIERDSGTGDIDSLLRADSVRIRLALFDGNLTWARETIEASLKTARENGFVTRATELLILKSEMHSIAGENDKSFLCLAEALDEGARCSLQGLFIREGSMIVDSLNEALSVRKLKRGTRRFCEEVLMCINGSASSDSASILRAPVATKRDSLTDREKQILDLLNKGMSRKEIASELGIAYNTVKVHISHVYEKLGVDNKLDAFHAAREVNGL